MNRDAGLALLLLAAALAGCAHGGVTRLRLEADSLGTPAAALTRALDGVQALDYTVTIMNGEGSRFEAEHGGRSLASLFGSDSSCRLRVQTEPAAREHASRVLVESEAHDAGSIAGCRKDAQAILKAAKGEGQPAPRHSPDESTPPASPPPRGTWGY
jgi:hypothetical protein